jgi:hypothetical protein
MNARDCRLMDAADAAIDTCNLQKIRSLTPRLRFFAASAAIMGDQEKLDDIRRLCGRLACLEHRVAPHELVALRKITHGRLAPLFWVG